MGWPSGAGAGFGGGVEGVAEGAEAVDQALQLRAGQRVDEGVLDGVNELRELRAQARLRTGRVGLGGYGLVGLG